MSALFLIKSQMAKKPTKHRILQLKPGNHSFVPGAHSFHNNENTGPEELQWYLEKYPHIQSMIEPEVTEIPEEDKAE